MPIRDFATGWQRLVPRWHRDRRAAGALILLYHRIDAPRSDPWSLAVSPSHFDAHLAVLRRCARPTSLQALCADLRAGRELSHQVVVSFDDGYLDNLTVAAPLLQRHGVPATVFVASGFVGDPREFWWDELERLLLCPGRLPPTLTLEIGGQERRWDFGDQADYGADDFARHRAWRAGGDALPTARHRAYADLHGCLAPMDDADRRRVMQQLRAVAGEAPPREGRRPLSRDELQALDRCPGLSVGVHTRTHPQLDRLPLEAQRRELLDARDELQRLLQRPLTSLAYPYGRYAESTPGLARELGFDVACTVNPGTVDADADPWRLNRVVVTDCDAPAFERWLRGWWAPR